MKPILLTILASFSAFSFASPIWTPIESDPQTNIEQAKPAIQIGKRFQLDLDQLQANLSQSKQEPTVELPLPNGKMQRFKLVPNSVLPLALQQRYPDIKSYTGYPIDSQDRPAAITISPFGISGMFVHQKEWVHVVAEEKANSHSSYVSFYSKQAQENSHTHTHGVHNDIAHHAPLHAEHSAKQYKPAPTGSTITTYRLALSATGEYTSAIGGSKATVMAEFTSLVNRVNQILLSDLAIQFQLV